MFGNESTSFFTYETMKHTKSTQDWNNVYNFLRAQVDRNIGMDALTSERDIYDRQPFGVKPKATERTKCRIQKQEKQLKPVSLNEIC